MPRFNSDFSAYIMPMSQMITKGAAYSYRDDPRVPDFKDDKPVIVFDGHCVLCSRFAGFIIRHDPAKKLRLLPAQSELGEALYAHYGLKPDDYDTNLLIANGRLRVKADGSMAIMSYLGWPWKMINIGRLLPRPVTDGLYGIIAGNRIKWFGRRKVCFMPPLDAAERFL